MISAVLYTHTYYTHVCSAHTHMVKPTHRLGMYRKDAECVLLPRAPFQRSPVVRGSYDTNQKYSGCLQSSLSIRDELVPRPTVDTKIRGCSSPTADPPHLWFCICRVKKLCLGSSVCSHWEKSGCEGTRAVPALVPKGHLCGVARAVSRSDTNTSILRVLSSCLFLYWLPQSSEIYQPVWISASLSLSV